MTHGRRRDPGLEQFWRMTLAKFRGSGLTVRQFCERHDLRDSTFYSWQRRLADRDRFQDPRSAAAPAPAFLPVRVVATLPLEVVAASGHVVRVGPGFDPVHLRAVVAALEAKPC